MAKTRQSLQYPMVSIQVCYEFIKLLDTLGGKDIPYSRVLEKINLTSKSSKKFIYRVSAGKQFGFLTSSRGADLLHLTDLGRLILNESNPEHVYTYLLNSFSSPPIYEMLLDAFDEKPVPSLSTLQKCLEEECHLLSTVSKTAALAFLDGAKYLGLIKNGLLKYYLKPDDDEQLKMPPTIQFDFSPAPVHGVVKRPAPSRPFTFSIPTLDGRAASISITLPDGVSSRDLEFLDKSLTMMLPEFLANLRAELSDPPKPK